MKKFLHTHKRKTAALLALALLLGVGLSACGKKDDGQDTPSTVYVPTFTTLDLASMEIDGLGRGCSDGTNLYAISNQFVPRTETIVNDAGEEEEIEGGDYRGVLLRIPLDGGTPELLSNYEPSFPFDLTGETGGYINDLSTGEEGTFWITETRYENIYDLPEGFDENTQNKWEFYSGEKRFYVVRQLDSTGAELDRMEIEETTLKEKLGEEYVNSLYWGGGNYYVQCGDTGGKFCVLDSGFNQLFTLETNSEGQNESLFNAPILLSDGTYGFLINYGYEDKEAGRYVSGFKLRTVDTAAKGWGKEYELPTDAYEVYPGGGDYFFYYRNGESIYGMKKGQDAGEQLFSWVASDINSTDVAQTYFLPNGNVAAVTSEWDRDGGESIYKLAVLTPTDASTLPEKTNLTFACVGLDYYMRSRIIEFNRASTTHRINVKDYAEFNTGEDDSAGLTRLNTEIGAGRVPDIIQIDSNINPRRYAAAGVLEDLWPFIDNDPDLGRDKLMSHVLEASEEDGKLIQVFSDFNIRTVVGAPSVVGDRMSWTLDDLQAALATMPERCTIFSESDTKQSMLTQVLYQNLNSFVDWESGACSFDTDQFKALLSFCNSFVDSYDWENVNWEEHKSDDERIRSGEQMLATVYLYGFYPVWQYKATFNGDISFIGFPQEDGGIGSAFSFNTGLAMSTTCQDKDGAWSFIRESLLPEYDEFSEEELRWAYYNSFKVNKADFDLVVDSCMTVQYQTDGEGNQILDEDGNPIIEPKYTYWTDGSDEPYTVDTLSQEDYDQIMELYNSIDTVFTYDQNIFDIVWEQAQVYFAGDIDLDTAANRIQSRVELYVNEQK